jgi:uncharacterized spore protein YtfJ
MTSFEEAIREAEADAKLPGQGLTERLMERLGGVANADAVFGAPIERDGLTVVPVAKVRWGAGGGGGSDASGDGGSGGGGGLTATPAGYIEIQNGAARFVRTASVTDLWPIVLAGAVAAFVVLRALRPFFMASRVYSG